MHDVIEDGRVSSVGDHGSPVGWLARGGGGKHKVLTVKLQPANIQAKNCMALTTGVAKLIALLGIDHSCKNIVI